MPRSVRARLKFDPTAGSKSAGGVSIDLSLGSGTFGKLVGWSSSAPVDAVIVKGANANVYAYSGGATGDTGLHTPFNGSSKYYGWPRQALLGRPWQPPRSDPAPDDPPADNPPHHDPRATTTRRRTIRPPDDPPADNPPADTPPRTRRRPTRRPPTRRPPLVPPASTRGRDAARHPGAGQVRALGPFAHARHVRLRRPHGQGEGERPPDREGRVPPRRPHRQDDARRGSYAVRSATIGFGRHRIVARVTYKAGIGTRPRTHVLTFQRCALQTLAPRFTG